MGGDDSGGSAIGLTLWESLSKSDWPSVGVTGTLSKSDWLIWPISAAAALVVNIGQISLKLTGQL